MSFGRSFAPAGVVRRIWRLPRRELQGLLRAYLGLAAVDLLLRARGLERMARPSTAERPLAPLPLTPEQRRQIHGYVRWIAAAAHSHLLPARCLHRSLLLHRWLLRDGLPSELRIGVRREGQALLAHAWVELGGQVVNDSATSVADFTVLRAPGGVPSHREAGSTRRDGGSTLAATTSNGLAG